jgi:predicted lactoylglutathione lyase
VSTDSAISERSPPEFLAFFFLRQVIQSLGFKRNAKCQADDVRLFRQEKKLRLLLLATVIFQTLSIPCVGKYPSELQHIAAESCFFS